MIRAEVGRASMETLDERDADGVFLAVQIGPFVFQVTLARRVK